MVCLMAGAETILDVVCWNDCVECQGQSFVGENLSDKILLYPNPSTGKINIKSIENIDQIEIVLFVNQNLEPVQLSPENNFFLH